MDLTSHQKQAVVVSDWINTIIARIEMGRIDLGYLSNLTLGNEYKEEINNFIYSVITKFNMD